MSLYNCFSPIGMHVQAFIIKAKSLPSILMFPIELRAVYRVCFSFVLSSSYLFLHFHCIELRRTCSFSLHFHFTKRNIHYLITATITNTKTISSPNH